MFTFLLRFLGNVLIGVCLAALSLVFMSVAALLRLTPRFLRFVRACLRGFLILSVRLYYNLFSRLTADAGGGTSPHGRVRGVHGTGRAL